MGSGNSTSMATSNNYASGGRVSSYVSITITLTDNSPNLRAVNDGMLVVKGDLEEKKELKVKIEIPDISIVRVETIPKVSNKDSPIIIDDD
jgi:hypothetical protein